MLNFVTWRWQSADPARHFPAAAVNILYAMLTRHYHAPFRLVCLTDDPTGIDGAVDVLPLPVTKADQVLVMPPCYPGFPSCFRRLWLFSAEACMLGTRICNIDLDVIILQDMTALLTTKTADFVGWRCGRRSWNRIGGALWLLTTGTHQAVWDTFDPTTSPHVAFSQGHRGSDQAWISQCLYPPLQRITEQDGVIKMNWMSHAGHPPGPDVRMVFTSGITPPWHATTQRGHPWIRNHYY